MEPQDAQELAEPVQRLPATPAPTELARMLLARMVLARVVLVRVVAQRERGVEAAVPPILVQAAGCWVLPVGMPARPVARHELP